jgi:lambda repressor-like predicted transcriptional regulator
VHEKEETIPVKPPSNTDTAAAVADLQKNWRDLQDLDRGRAVNVIHQAGTSLRSLAKALTCSPSLLRRLIEVDQAPLEDQLLARQGKITTNELLRRSSAAAAAYSFLLHFVSQVGKAKAASFQRGNKGRNYP